VPRVAVNQESDVPKSKVRKKPAAPTRTQSATSASKVMTPSPAWYPVVMAVVLVIGLAYLVVYYLAGQDIPIMRDINGWNFAVGFGIMLVGLIMAVRWR
jgi:membrane protein YdbS with pleckstrin-like domain